MNKKSTFFVVITLAVAGAAWYISHTRAPETNVGTPPLFPALSAKINDVVQVDVKSRKNSASLEKKGDNWVIANRDDYPATFEKVKSAILDVSDMKILEAKTKKPSLYSRLDVQDVSAAKSQSVQITLKDKNGKVLASLIVGKKREGRPSPLGTLRYVRPAGKAQSYLVAGDIDINADPLSWTSRQVADINSSRIRSVRLEQPGQPPVEVDRDKPSDVNFTMQNIPNGLVPKSSAMVTSLSTVLEELHFDDVRAKDKLKWPAATDVATLRGFDGLVATIRTAKIDDHDYSTLNFSFDPADVQKTPATGNKKNDDKTAAKNDKGNKEKTQSVADEVKALNTKLGHWAFVLPDFKVSMLTTSQANLLTKKQKPKPMVKTPPMPKDPMTLQRFDKNGHLLPNVPAGTEHKPAASAPAK